MGLKYFTLYAAPVTGAFTKNVSTLYMYVIKAMRPGARHLLVPLRLPCALVTRQIVALNSAAQHAMPPQFCGKRETEVS